MKQESKKQTNLDIDGAYSTKATALECPPIFLAHLGSQE